MHGGVCLPAHANSLETAELAEDTTGSRFSCKCKPPYRGPRCAKTIKSCRGYKKGPRISGLHKIADENGTIVDVYCDFDSTQRATWTLVQSHVRDMVMKSLQLDSPISPDTPSRTGYRLQKSRMETIQGDSTKWRITCEYNKTAPLTDYIYGSINDLDILKPITNCEKVDFIKIRDQSCSNCTVYFFQNSGFILHAYTNFKHPCDFNITASAGMSCIPGEYFGHFGCKDEMHACSSSPYATTQVWFGI